MEHHEVDQIVANFRKQFETRRSPDVAGVLRSEEDIKGALSDILFGKGSPGGFYPIHLEPEDRSNGTDHDVVLTIGINYGQSATYAGPGKTGMRNSLVALNKRFPKLIPRHYHLVAWNAFPKITARPWSSANLNGLEEALALWMFGIPPNEWRKATVQLVEEIAPRAIVFHGVNNSVPYYGFQVVDLLRPQSSLDHPRVVFCGNLATALSVRSARTTIEVWPPIARGHIHVVNDE